MIFQEARDAQYRLHQREQDLQQLTSSYEGLSEEKLRLLREIAQLKKSGNVTSSGSFDVYPTPQIVQSTYASPSDAALASIGSLKAYEMALGLCFVTIVLNWILM